jgi:TetR/AcrR family transcriptional regulator, fatty acid metabolism regulator protein
MRKTREERRAEIAAAALNIVGEYGVQGATMARIADSVGISGPALYKHFSGRDEILEAAMDLLLLRVVSWLDSSANPNALERLRELGSRHALTLAADYEGVVAPLFEFAAAGPRSQLSGQLARRQRAALQRFVGIIEEGQTQGTIRRDIDVQVTAWSLMGLTWIENLAALEGMEEFVTDGVSSRMLDRILAEIAAPGDGPARVGTTAN